MKVAAPLRRHRAIRWSRLVLAPLAAAVSIGVLVAQQSPILPPPGMVGPAKETPKKPGGEGSKKPAAAAPAAPAAAAPITLTPRAWPRSSYNFEGRLESTVQDVTFEVPAAYKDSFAFWGGRMKGTERTELIQYITSTHEAEENGDVPFHRQVARYMVDLSEHGQVRTMGGQVNRDVQNLAWDGRLDARGRIVEIKRVAAPADTAEVDRLAFPMLDDVLPVLDGPRSLKTGESVTFESTLPLPSRMSVKGLEDVAARMTRVFTLKELRDRQAVFAVKTTYAIDPGTPPKADRTTCVIGGGGDGEAIFDLDAGYFLSARITTKMTIDIEAPLRPLPDQPQGTDPGTGKSHLALVLTMYGKQAAAQMFSAESPSQ